MFDITPITVGHNRSVHVLIIYRFQTSLHEIEIPDHA